MSRELNVLYDGESCYNIHVEKSFDNFIKCLPFDLLANGRKVCIVSDSEVANLYLENFKSLIKSSFSKVESFVFPNGEASKNLGTAEKLYEHLIKSHFDRHDLLIALGGGVVGDLTGFCAATYLRGIDFVQVPTTLLSQVDSSIGGKTGVDFLQYKNMVGAFYMPRMVYINTSALKTLPKEQFASGMGEVMKHGLIRDKDYYTWLKENSAHILDLEDDYLEKMVARSCEIKREVVQIDPKEQGIRAHLNFGHTLGHAVEKLSDFSLFHGQCVAIGMRGAAYLSMQRGYLSSEEYADIIHTIQQYNLPDQVSNFHADEVLAATKSDKKMVGDKIKFIILKQMGEADIDTTFTDADILKAIEEIIK